MILRNIDFGPVLDASGVQGFFGEGYKHYRLLGPFGPNFDGSTFVAKTTTLELNKGNMPMKKNGITPEEWKPRCIKAYPLKGIMLNAVGLSGPGAKSLFEKGLWQKRKKPFFLSFMSIAQTPLKRFKELAGFVEMLKQYLPYFRALIGLQINFSCPNVGLKLGKITMETKDSLEKASELGIPLMPKFSVVAPVEAVAEIFENPHCDAICISNTIPWGQFPERINWKKLFGVTKSPLSEFGGGGLSGKPLLPLVAEWIQNIRDMGIKKPINAGGGILCLSDVDILYNAGASSVFVGSAATLRPWRVQKIIQRAHQLFKKGGKK